MTPAYELVFVNSSHKRLRSDCASLSSSTFVQQLSRMATYLSSRQLRSFHPPIIKDLARRDTSPSHFFTPQPTAMTSQNPAHIQSPLPSVILGHFNRQIHENHFQTSDRSPLPLHFDTKTRSLGRYLWYVFRFASPAPLTQFPYRPRDRETKRLVAPSMLADFRRTHMFRAPCCLCPFMDGSSDYVETFIGVVEVAHHQPNELHGEYVAVCSSQRCGYLRQCFLLLNVSLLI